MVDLNTLIPPNSNLQLVETLAINDRGQIAGDGLPPGCLNDVQCGHAYVLIPCESGDSDTEGCKDKGEDTAVATERSFAPATRPADATQGKLTSEILAALRVRFSRRYRGFETGPRN